MNSEITLITGGAKSGKSSFALDLVNSIKNKVFLATALAFDEEMKEKIRLHQEERDDEFSTIEEPVFISKAIEALPEKTEAVVIDCLTLWLNNLLYSNYDSDLETQISLFKQSLMSTSSKIIIISNELGMGLVPPTKESRVFRDRSGRLNQEISEMAASVYFVVSGIPMKIK